MRRALPLLALLAAGCGSGEPASSPRAAPNTAASESAAPAATPRGDPCASTPREGDVEVPIIRGVEPVNVHLPPGLQARRAAPLVVGVHGAGQTARAFEGETVWSDLADDEGFVVAYPESWRDRFFWKYPEADNPRSGLRILRAAIDAAAKVACIDRDRVLVTGISSGGRMTYSAGCEMADVVLAIGPVSAGTADLPPCRPARPVSVVDIHGTADPIVAYGGRGPSRDGRVLDVMARWARVNGCARTPRVDRRYAEAVTRHEWPRCRGNARVIHLAVRGGGHGWPPLGGPPGVGIDAAQEIWKVFSRLRRRARASSERAERLRPALSGRGFAACGRLDARGGRAMTQ